MTAATTLGLVGWAIALFFTIALSLLISSRTRTGRLSLDVAVFVFWWIFVTTLWIFVNGLAGQLTPLTLSLTAGTGLLLICLHPWTRTALVDAIQGMRRWEGAPGRWKTIPRGLRLLLLLLGAVTLVRSLFLILSLPPFIWDSLTYHLTNVAQWIQDGRIGLFVTPIDRIYTPANYEVLAAWFAVFIQHDAVIEAAGLPAFVLIGISVYALARGLGLSQTASWIAVAAHLTVPAVVFAATGTKNDPYIAAIYLFSLALIVELRRRIGASLAIEPIRFMVVVGASLLFALGTKAYILHLAPGLLVAAIWSPDGLSVRQAGGRFAAAFRREIRDLRGGDRWLFSALFAGALTLGLFWYARNWSLTGNPFYPYGVQVGDRVVLETGLGGFRFDFGNLLDNLRLLAAKFGDKAGRIVPDLPETTGWGWVAYGMGIPAALWAWVSARRFRPVFAGFGVSLLVLLLSSPTSPWNMRYVAWFPAVLALALGFFADRVREEGSSLRRAMAALFVFCLAMNTAMTFDYNLVAITEFQRMLALPLSGRAAGLLHVRAPQEYESAYHLVPDDAVLGYNVTANGFVYPLYRPNFSQRLVFVPFSAGDECASIAQAMRSRGTRYLFVAPEQTDDFKIARLRSCAAIGTVIRERAIGLYVTP